LGYPPATNAWGLWFETGWGLDRDFVLLLVVAAARCFKRSADLGYPTAICQYRLRPDEKEKNTAGANANSLEKAHDPIEYVGMRADSQ
jgi:TPR repeat protein